MTKRTITKSNNLPVAQLDSASDSDSEGQRFKSVRVGHDQCGDGFAIPDLSSVAGLSISFPSFVNREPWQGQSHVCSALLYLHPSFGYLLIIAEAIYCFRCIYSTVSTNANKYKETKPGAILECATNLAVSLILVSFAGMGLLGVAIGTVVGMFTRYIFDVVFLSKNVIFRSVLKAVKMFITSICVAGASLALCNLVLDYSCVNTVQSWLVYAVITSIMVAVIASVVYLIFYFDVIKSLIKKLLRRG